ncbi:hypothetical protein [Nonomuraea basaltis]|uniref:hypothetical protein n=1 Tax=Nonomuraea basaltis TaxID=2495887 RepID=UPI0014875B3D|nr:hypothetical protein [Nonomuraea basaltis]
MWRPRRWLGWAVIAFAVFYLFTRPAQAAGAVKGVFGGILNSADQLAVFCVAVLG